MKATSILYLILLQSVTSQEVAKNESNSTDTTGEKDETNLQEARSEPRLNQTDTHYCTCDLKPFLCDINCCCDKICKDDERKLFSHCLNDVSRTSDSKYCYSKSLLYTINAVHEAASLSGNLFCIAWDNVVRKDEHSELETITNLAELKKVSPGTKHSWFHVREDRTFFKPKHRRRGSSSELISGDALRVLESARNVLTFDTWKLPHALLIANGVCNSFQPVTYLNNFKSTCKRIVSDLRSECSSNLYFSPRIYYENIIISKNKPSEVVIGSLHLTKHYLSESDEKYGSENKYSMASDQCSAAECVTVTVNGSYDMPQYVYDGQRKIGACFNAVTSVSYDVSFEAKTGITEVIVTFKQSPIIQGQKYLQQSFSVNFNQEINSSLLLNEHFTQERSGNPGYLFNKRILGTSFEKDMNSTSVFKLTDPIQSKSDGSCKTVPSSIGSNSEVGFRVNTKNGCIMNLNNFRSVSNSICSDLQTEIVNIWTSTDQITHFGVFGNSNVSNVNHWIPVIIDNSMAQITNPSLVPVLTLDDNCPSIITSISYDIYFADIGLKSETQSMILSVVKKFSDPIEVKMHSSSNGTGHKLGSLMNPWIEVSFSVGFHDLTIPSRPSFAPPPTVKLQLPPDFFYPFFVSSSSGKRTETCFFCKSIILTCPLFTLVASIHLQMTHY